MIQWKPSYSSNYDSDSNSVACENQPLEIQNAKTVLVTYLSDTDTQVSILGHSVWCYTCVEEICEFDGSELILLNMGSYIVSYEVLRDFMFHFLKRRYM